MIDLLIKNARYLNVFTKEIIHDDIAIDKGVIVGFGDFEAKKVIDLNGKYVVPGFIDGHIHLESSIVPPIEFSKLVYKHGTTTVITDPHEIANVCGVDGINYMLDATKNTLIDVFFMVPSCVPASIFDESGYVLSLDEIESFLKNDRFLGLAEMMNYPGVIYDDETVKAKINLCKKYNKIIDGHAPLLSNKDLMKYISEGIYSDHECSNTDEAYEKIKYGMNIMVREGTAGKNLASLIEIIKKYPNRCMFSTDDKHPSDLLEGHIDYIIKKAISLGANPIDAYIIGSYNAARYFNLNDRGAIAPGYIADLVILSDFDNCVIEDVLKNGERKNVNAKVNVDTSKVTNTVRFNEINKKMISINKGKVIGLIPGDIITKDLGYSDELSVDDDILKVCVVERHNYTGHVGVAYVKGYGLKKGAVATTVAHDSHNIIVVGTNDDDILLAINRLKEIEGGIVITNNKIVDEFSFPIAGLMSTLCVKDASKKLEEMKNAAYKLGVNKKIDPFMTLSFVSLPVIPELKLTTLGVVDVKKFELVKE